MIFPQASKTNLLPLPPHETQRIHPVPPQAVHTLCWDTAYAVAAAVPPAQYALFAVDAAVRAEVLTVRVSAGVSLLTSLAAAFAAFPSTAACA